MRVPTFCRCFAWFVKLSTKQINFFVQAEDIYKKFEQLKQMQQNNWQSEKPVAASTTAQAVKVKVIVVRLPFFFAYVVMTCFVIKVSAIMESFLRLCCMENEESC